MTKERADELMALFDDEAVRVVVRPLVEELADVEDRIQEIKKLPLIRVHPADPSIQKSTAAGRLYHTLLAKQTDIVRMLLRQLGKSGDDGEDSPLRAYLRTLERRLDGIHGLLAHGPQRQGLHRRDQADLGPALEVQWRGVQDADEVLRGHRGVRMGEHQARDPRRRADPRGGRRDGGQDGGGVQVQRPRPRLQRPRGRVRRAPGPREQGEVTPGQHREALQGGDQAEAPRVQPGEAPERGDQGQDTGDHYRDAEVQGSRPPHQRGPEGDTVQAQEAGRPHRGRRGVPLGAGSGPGRGDEEQFGGLALLQRVQKDRRRLSLEVCR